MKAQLLIVCAAMAAMANEQNAHAAQHPFFSFDFGSFQYGGATTHTDTFKINALKPVRDLTLTLTTTDTVHLPAESGFLLDLSGAQILNETNDAHVLSIVVLFPGSGLSGFHTAARITFYGEFHDTVATSSGTFVDGSKFTTSTWVGFIPEPATGTMFFVGAAMLTRRRSRW